MPRTASLLIALLLALSLRQTTEPATDPGLDATLWVQTAAEWRGLARQTWNGAADRLDGLLEESMAVAALEQAADGEAWARPPAIIVDIDETVLDNSPYQARLILAGADYDEESWDAWVEERRAAPVPGALAFLSKAAARGVTIFYVTNRKAHLEEATRANLLAFGFPLATEHDCVLMRGEREDWGKDKGSRRAFVAKGHRIVMLVGDDLGDFISSARSDLVTRGAMIQELGDRWGRSWFLLPNPCYGSWKEALTAFRGDLGPEASSELLLRQLDPRQD